jgi:hypothetical protein
MIRMFIARSFIFHFLLFVCCTYGRLRIPPSHREKRIIFPSIEGGFVFAETTPLADHEGRLVTHSGEYSQR